MKTRLQISNQGTLAMESKQDLLHTDRFVKGVVLPLGIGVSLYALTATGMIVYDVITKLF